MFPLQFQQTLLDFQTSAISHHVPGRPDYPVAGYHSGDLLIGSGFPIWNLQQSVPHFGLELCSMDGQRQGADPILNNGNAASR